MSEAELIKTILDRIVPGFAPLKVILFGSRARGQAGPDSDIDLLVVLPRNGDLAEPAIAMLRALKDLPVPKDVLVSTPEDLRSYGTVPGTVLHAALAEGRVLFER